MSDTIQVTQQITEEMGIHKDWYSVKPKNVDELAAFARKLLTEYNHDYDTICHAAAALAHAAAWTVNNDPDQGGITGFQSGAIMWEFIRHWQYLQGPARLQRFENLLYPQYADEYRSIPLSTFRWAQEEARKRLSEGGTRLDPNEELLPAHPDVIAHWKRIADGEVPFGLKIKD